MTDNRGLTEGGAQEEPLVGLGMAPAIPGPATETPDRVGDCSSRDVDLRTGRDARARVGMLIAGLVALLVLSQGEL